MIIQSLVSDKKYIWLRVPRTATHSYGKIFFPDGNYKHNHCSYYHETDLAGELLPAFSVVRNPHARFVSCLQHMVKRQKHNGFVGQYDFTIPFENIELLTEWLLENTNALKKPEISSYKKIFKTENPEFVVLFFKQQGDYVNFPGVDIFKFEALEEYNLWISNTLGYDTSNVQKLNSSSDELLHLDFQNVDFIKATEQYFYEDYTVFNYPFQQLT